MPRSGFLGGARIECMVRVASKMKKCGVKKGFFTPVNEMWVVEMCDAAVDGARAMVGVFHICT